MQRREAVQRAMRGHAISQRRACVLVGVDPKTVRRIAREANSPGVATGIDAGNGAVLVENPPPRPPAPGSIPTRDVRKLRLPLWRIRG